MRNAFADEITNLAIQNEKVVLLSGDIGNRLFNTFKEKVPARFYNCGVAESNMMGVAAGMAACGFRPVAYTITPFTTFRCHEFIKLDVCYHKAPVMIVGVGSGLGYASLGPTHHSLEDIGALRVLPNLTIVCPADAWEVRAALRAGLNYPGPMFVRIGKKNEPVIHDRVPEFTIGQAMPLRAGAEVCLLAAGTILPNTLEAAKLMAQADVSPEVINYHTIKPLDTRVLEDVFGRFRLVVTIEEHSLIGGLGAAVAEWLADRGPVGARLLRLGTPDAFLHTAGSQKYARRLLGLDPESICQRVLRAFEATK